MFDTISPDVLNWVIGGKQDTNAALTAMLTQITGSLKELGANKSSSMDQMLPMMMMMMMMGKGGGGGQQVVAAAPPPPPPPEAAAASRISVNVG
jgi:hypothetical protein